MPAIDTISPEKLLRLIGTPNCPLIVDVRTDDDFEANAQFIPGALRRRPEDVRQWGAGLAGKSAVVVCRAGQELSQGAASWLRALGVSAEALEGGVSAWTSAHLPMVPAAKLPKRDGEGRTVWITRSRPKVDRIACPWLIRRFVDPGAVFLFAPPSDVLSVAARFGATPFDVEGEGVIWSHDGERCTFDVMADAFGLLAIDGLKKLAPIVRGADTARPDLVPEAAGLLAASLGLSRMYADDLEQLEAGMVIYDAFFRWCRDATEETHNWTSHKPSKAAKRP